MSERIQIMRWRPRDPLAVHSGERSLEPTGDVVDFVITFEHGGLKVTGPADATKEERAEVWREVQRRYPGYVLR